MQEKLWLWCATYPPPDSYLGKVCSQMVNGKNSIDTIQNRQSRAHQEPPPSSPLCRYGYSILIYCILVVAINYVAVYSLYICLITKLRMASDCIANSYYHRSDQRSDWRFFSPQQSMKQRFSISAPNWKIIKGTNIGHRGGQLNAKQFREK